MVELFKADLVDSPAIAEGGRSDAEGAVDSVDVVLDPAPKDLDDSDFAGV